MRDFFLRGANARIGRPSALSWRHWVYKAGVAAIFCLLLSCLFLVATIATFNLPQFDEWRLFQRWGEAANTWDAFWIRHNLYHLGVLNLAFYFDIKLFNYSGALPMFFHGSHSPVLGCCFTEAWLNPSGQPSPIEKRAGSFLASSSRF